MPIIQDHNYRPAHWLKWGHSNTIYPNLFRRVSLEMSEEIIHTPDHDFLTLASIQHKKDQAVLILHGLNGTYRSVYVQGLIRAFLPLDLDIYALNQRGCGPEINKQAKLYHCGFTEDIPFLLNNRLKNYQKVHLVGVSLGANVVLKYLGEYAKDVPEHLGRTLAINPPGSLMAGSRHLDNSVYRVYFLWEMKRKGLLKARQFPQRLNAGNIKRALSLVSVDRTVTAPLAGYDDVDEYYEKESWTYQAPKIRHEAHLLTARDDPFFPRKDAPASYCADHDFLHCHITRYGGHAGHFNGHGKESYAEIWARNMLS